LSIIDKLNRFIGLYIFAVKSFFKGAAWFPFVVYGLIQLMVLIILVNHINPILNPILAPLVALAGGDSTDLFYHYPTLYLMLPLIYNWFKLAVGVIFEGLFSGFTVILILKIIDAAKFGKLNFSFVRRRWFQLAIVWTAITAIILAVIQFFPSLFAEQIAASIKIRTIVRVAMGIIQVGLFSILMYIIPYYIISAGSLGTAVRKSFTAFAQNPIFSFFLALVPYLFTVPVSFAIDNTPKLMEKFSPELIFYILSFGIFMEFLANYLLIATLTKFLSDEA